MAQNPFTLDLNLKAYPNTLTPDVADDYTVRVDTQSTPLTLDDIARVTAERLGEETVKIRAALQVGMEVMAQAVASGFCVSTPLCYAQPMACGVVMEHELSQPVDREKIRVYASFRQGSAMTEAIGQAKLQLFLQPAATGPYIAGMTSAFFNEQSAAGGAVTRVPLPMEAGGMAVITGNGLKVVGADPTVGVTLTSVTEPSTKFFIPAAKISPNTPKKLQFVLPAGVTEGEWTVSVTTQYAGSYQTKEPRTFTLPRPITIGEVPEGGGGSQGGQGGGGDDGEDPLG